jgi:hypothetical protein
MSSVVAVSGAGTLSRRDPYSSTPRYRRKRRYSPGPREAQERGQRREDADLDVIVDQLWGAGYHRLLVLKVPFDKSLFPPGRPGAVRRGPVAREPGRRGVRRRRSTS